MDKNSQDQMDQQLLFPEELICSSVEPRARGSVSPVKWGGVNDLRSKLCLTYIDLLKTMRPRWFVWENVPGVFSTNRGEDFREFIRQIDEIGYSLAWRVLDAQYVRVDGYPRAIPQRRRRVFVVGCLMGWEYPGSVLFEPNCLSRCNPPRRIKGEGFARDAQMCAGKTSGTFRSSNPGDFIEDGSAGTIKQNIQSSGNSSATLCVSMGNGQANSLKTDSELAQTLNLMHDQQAIYFSFMAGQGSKARSIGYTKEASPTLKSAESGSNQIPNIICCNASQDPICHVNHANPVNLNRGQGNVICQYGDIAGTLEARHDSSPCSDRGQNIICYDARGNGDGETANTMTGDHQSRITDYTALAITENQIGRKPQNGPNGIGVQKELAYTQNATGVMGICQKKQVRRLLPIETERLMGFPDNWTRLTVRIWDTEPTGNKWRKFRDLFEKNADGTWTEYCSDGPRYRACGNSMCVNVMRWIGMRIELANRKTDLSDKSDGSDE